MDPVKETPLITLAAFVALRTSDGPADQRRAGHEAADVAVWLEVLELLASGPDERVR